MAARDKVEWTLVQLEGDDQPSRTADESPGDEELTPPGPALGKPDPDAFQVVVKPPFDADPEILMIDKELQGAEDEVKTAVQVGYWIHGPGYFEALRDGINGPLANEHQGSQEPLRRLSADQLGQVTRAANTAIEEQQKEISTALTAVQSQSASYARARLQESQQQIMTTTMRYIKEADTRRRASSWLRTSELSGGAHTFTFVEDEGIDLLRGLWTIWSAHRVVAEREAKLARAMRESGPEMQRIAADRWQYVRGRDRANTRAANTYRSTDYGIELMRTQNAKHPDLVAEAEGRFPEPARVLAARLSVYEAAGLLATALVDEGTLHPLLYRIWSPSLAEMLRDRLEPSGSLVTMKPFSIFELRSAVSDTLRSAWSASTSLSEKIAQDAAHVWHFPLLVSVVLDEIELESDAFNRVAAEHRLEELAEADARLQRFFAHAGSVLTAAGLAVRLVPVPAVSVPASVVIAAVDLVVSGVGLLVEYFKQTDTREGFRAFLNPGESFAASDGSYFGTIVGAAFLLFGVAGLRRTSFTPPTRVETAIAAGLVGQQEYRAFASAERRP